MLVGGLAWWQGKGRVLLRGGSSGTPPPFSSFVKEQRIINYSVIKLKLQLFESLQGDPWWMASSVETEGLAWCCLVRVPGHVLVGFRNCSLTTALCTVLRH